MNKDKKKSTSELLMDELEPIINHSRRKDKIYKDTHTWEDEGGAIHPTEHDESDDLEDAKAISTDLATRRGYTKRYNKMNERLDHLEYVLQLRQNPDIMDKIEEFKQRVTQIDDNEPGKLI